MSKVYYKIMRKAIKTFFPKQKINDISNEENRDECAIYVANHSQAFSPIALTLYFDKTASPWIIGDMTKYKTAYAHSYVDFYNGDIRPKFSKKVLSCVTSLLLVPALKSANGIEVYHDTRIIQTFKDSVNSLCNNKNIIIFAESRQKYGKFINRMNNGFVDVAKYYHIKTGKCVKFYPVYVAPYLNTINIGRPITYDPNVEIKQQRIEIARYLESNIEEIGNSLPTHKVVPYANG